LYKDVDKTNTHSPKAVAADTTCPLFHNCHLTLKMLKWLLTDDVVGTAQMKRVESLA